MNDVPIMDRAGWDEGVKRDRRREQKPSDDEPVLVPERDLSYGEDDA